MTQSRTTDLQLGAGGDSVILVEFGRHVFGFRTHDGRLAIHAPFTIRWSDGTTEEFAPANAAGTPASLRLLESLLGVGIRSSTAGVERARLHVVFENGVEISVPPSGSIPHNWYAQNAFGTQFVSRTTGELQSWGGAESDNLDDSGERELGSEPVPTSVDEAQAIAARGKTAARDEPRVIDLEITDHIYGVTVYGAGIQLETRGGSFYLGGPLTVTDAAGERFTFDASNLGDDTVAGAVLAVLIDHPVESYLLKPDTSEFTVALAHGGGRLEWKASSASQARFSARLAGGREFWSKGDGTIYWYGGPEGAHPKFLAGGPNHAD